MTCATKPNAAPSEMSESHAPIQPTTARYGRTRDAIKAASKGGKIRKKKVMKSLSVFEFVQLVNVNGSQKLVL